MEHDEFAEWSRLVTEARRQVRRANIQIMMAACVFVATIIVVVVI